MINLNTSPTKDFFVEIARGNINGAVNTALGGHNPNIEVSDFGANNDNPDNVETIWEQGGTYTYLTADTQLYVSSTDVSDNGIVIVRGLDSNYNEITRLVTLNGQNQVALSGLMFRVVQATAFTTNIGDIYIAESDSLTSGVPDTAAKIKNKIIAGRLQSATAIDTIPANKSGFIYDLEGSIGKSKDTNVFIKFKIPGFDILTAPPFEVFETTFNFIQGHGLLLGETTDIELAAATRDITSPVTTGLKVIFFDN